MCWAGRWSGCVGAGQVGAITFDRGILDSIGAALTKAGMYERAGEFFEKLQKFNEARDAYRRGNAYRRAVDLARREFPGEVVRLEEEWGDWLVHQVGARARACDGPAGQGRVWLEPGGLCAANKLIQA